MATWVATSRQLCLLVSEEKRREVMDTNYDSRKDTLNHIELVRENLNVFVAILLQRAADHDLSKLKEPEKSMFDEWTPKLKELTYGSDEYKQALASLGEALRHHYANNSHHPEHHKEGIDDMTLFDVIEMFCDWQAASRRHADGDFTKSLEINRERFWISQQLASIFENTQKNLDW